MTYRALAYYLLMDNLFKNRKEREQKRRLERVKLKLGKFVTLYPTLRQCEKKFFKYLRMSVKTFDSLLDLIETDIERISTTSRVSISPEEKLVLTLRFLATGCSFADLHQGYLHGAETIQNIVEEVCSVLWDKFKPLIPQMTTEKWLEMEEGFKKYPVFPNCIGAIDVKRIELEQPSNLVMVAICDVDYNLIYVDIESFATNCDSEFQNSALYKRLLVNTSNIPNPTLLSSIDKTPFPHILAGNEAFDIMKNILQPYNNEHLEDIQKIFNYRLLRTHRYINLTLGMLDEKWRIMQKPLKFPVMFAEKIVKACTVLHNYVKFKDGYKDEDTWWGSSLQSINAKIIVPDDENSSAARDRFADYFKNEGRVET